MSDTSTPQDAQIRKFMKKHELAEQLGLPVRVITRWVKERAIPYLRVGKGMLFTLEDALQTLERFKVNATTEGDSGAATAQSPAPEVGGTKGGSVAKKPSRKWTQASKSKPGIE